MPPPAAFPVQMCPPRNSNGEVVGVVAVSGCPDELEGTAQRWISASRPGDAAVSILPLQDSLGWQTPAHYGVCQQMCPPCQGPMLPVSRGVFLQLARAPQLDAGAPTPLLLSRPMKLFLFPRENKGKPRKSVWRRLSTKGFVPSVPEAEAPGGVAANPVRSGSRRGGFSGSVSSHERQGGSEAPCGVGTAAERLLKAGKLRY